MTKIDPQDNVLTITRDFAQPVELLWEAWTIPASLMLWWGPKNFTTPFCKTDFRIGGKYHFCMRSPEGKDFWTAGVYKEIIPLKRIALTDSFADKDGNIMPASSHGLTGEWPEELIVTVAFEESNGKTKMTMTHAGLPAAWKDMTGEGWNQMFDKLEEILR
jgi:uncharacterized protein YndB with AHSA1/START domain